jgi:mannosyltransferase OCH1-like enzyme
MLIPKVLHQTWKTKALPAEFSRFRKSWEVNHPEWDLRLYDDAACRRFVVDEYPDLLEVYDSLSTNIERADVFRYLVVHRHGGVYADLDMECYRSIEPLLTGRSCVFGIEATFGEPLRKRLNYRRPYQVANCIFAAVSGHPFLQLLLDRIQPARGGDFPDDLVEDTTGPRFLTRVFQEMRDEFPDVTLLPQIHWTPPKDYPNRFPWNVQIYCRHHFAGTWRSHGGADTGGWWRRFRERWYHPWPWPRVEAGASGVQASPERRPPRLTSTSDVL